MPRTEAQAAASRANGLKSRGPVTPEGKAISRRNALKHGMTAEALLPEEDAAEVARRSAAMTHEMRPHTEMGRFLVHRIARLTVRVERCADAELAHNAYNSTHAEAAFDEARVADVDHTLSWIGVEPATSARKLRSMPEGVDRMIACLLELREVLDTPRWDWCHGEKVSHLRGHRYIEQPMTRVHALSEAILGRFEHLDPEDGAGLSIEDRKHWARCGMAELIDAEVEKLLEHRETLDFESIEADRSTAARRVGFDASKEAVLARRYEAAAERGVFQALKELRKVEAEAAARAEEPGPMAEPVAEPEKVAAPGSSRKEVVSVPPPAPSPAPMPLAIQHALIHSNDDGPRMVGVGPGIWFDRRGIEFVAVEGVGEEPGKLGHARRSEPSST